MAKGRGELVVRGERRCCSPCRVGGASSSSRKSSSLSRLLLSCPLSSSACSSLPAPPRSLLLVTVHRPGLL